MFAMEATVDPPSPGSRLDADHPENGVLIPCLFTAAVREGAVLDRLTDLVENFPGRKFQPLQMGPQALIVRFWERGQKQVGCQEIGCICQACSASQAGARSTLSRPRLEDRGGR